MVESCENCDLCSAHFLVFKDFRRFLGLEQTKASMSCTVVLEAKKANTDKWYCF